MQEKVIIVQGQFGFDAFKDAGIKWITGKRMKVPAKKNADIFRSFFLERLSKGMRCKIDIFCDLENFSLGPFTDIRAII